MKFLVDTQLPPRFAKFLSEKGFDAIHITHFPNGHLLDDESIRRMAIAVLSGERGAVLIYWRMHSSERDYHLTRK